MSNGLRACAAAFVIGLSLAGPQAAGTASAAPSDGESSVSTDRDQSSPPTRAGRSAGQTRSAAVPGATADRDAPDSRRQPDVQRPAQPAAAADSALVHSDRIAEADNGSRDRRYGYSRAGVARAVVAPAESAPSAVPAVIAVPGVGTSAIVAPPPAAASSGATSNQCGSCWALNTPSVAQRIATVSAAVNGFFDTVADWLSSLPPNPVSAFTEGALLMVRRTLFNQSPTAAPVQWAQTATNIVGTVGATDPEGDPIVYTVVTQPKYGVVVIDPSSGGYTYTPRAFDNYGGTDEFTVQISDTGAHLHLLQNASIDVTVPVTISAVAALQGYSRGFDLYNLTSKTLVYSINDRGTPESGPSFGTEFKPGEKARFELTYYVFEENIVRVGFNASDGSGIWAVDMRVADNILGSTATQSCYASGSNKCIDKPFGSTYLKGGGFEAYFLDPPNTIFNIAGSDKQQQADRLNGLCFSGSVASCSFTVNKAKTDPGGTLSSKFADPQLAANTYTNSTNRDQTWTASTSIAQATETSWSLSANVKLTLIDKVLDASLTGTYGQRWATTETFTNTYITTVPPGTTAYLYQRNPVRTAVGDFTVKMGNTTWNLTDVEFVYPDGSRKPNIEARFSPITT